MLRLLRFAMLLGMTFIAVSLVIAVATPEIGPVERLILGMAFVGVLIAARPVQRLGSGRA